MTSQSETRNSYVFLGISLLIVTIVFGVRVAYSPGLYYTIAALQFGAIAFAAWLLGARAVRALSEERRTLAVSGSLMVTAWALFSLLPGIGPPGFQTHQENELRYLILLIDAIALTGGLVVLHHALGRAGEFLFSTLGFAAMVVAAPLYLIWASVMLAFHRAAELTGSNAAPVWIASLSDLSDILLFFGGVMTYLATAAFAVALGRVQWLGKRSARAFVILSFVALTVLASRGLAFPDPAVVFSHWYMIPGFIVGIPAVPWIMPCLIGITLLRRAGVERA